MKRPRQADTGYRNVCVTKRPDEHALLLARAGGYCAVCERRFALRDQQASVLAHGHCLVCGHFVRGEDPHVWVTVEPTVEEALAVVVERRHLVEHSVIERALRALL